MAARRGIVLTEQHRDRVAAGLATLSETAIELGLTKQALHTNFRRRGWPTRPIDLDDNKHQALAPADDEPAASAAQRRTRPQRAHRAASPSPSPRQRPAASQAPTIDLHETEITGKALARAPTAPTSASAADEAPSLPPAQIAYPGQPEAASAAIPSSTFADGDDLVEVARQELGNVGLLVLAQTRDALARAQLGAQAIKALAGAAEVADRLLKRAGLDVASLGDGQTPQLLIREMTAKQQEEIQASVEAEYRGEMPGDPVDDVAEL